MSLNNRALPIIKKIVHLNSKFRSNGTSSNFNYRFPTPINNIISMKINSIDIPNSWYNFGGEGKNAYFYIIVHKRKEEIVDDDGHRVTDYHTKEIDGTKYRIEIPEGNWDADELTNYLNTTYFSNGDLQYIKFTIFMKILKTKFETKYNAPKSFKFDVIFKTKGPIVYSCGWILGFRMGSYKNISNTLMSEGLFDGGTNRYLFISINDYQSNLVFRWEGLIFVFHM